VEVFVKVIIVIVAKVEGDRPLVNDGGVAEARPDRIEAAPERPNRVTRTGIAV